MEMWLEKAWTRLAPRAAVYVCMLMVLEFFLGLLIIAKVPYTEIDWIAYMQEVKGFLDGELDYSKLRGGTGPLVYPAGFVYLYSGLYYATNLGTNIIRAQYIYLGLYLVTIAVVFTVYVRAMEIDFSKQISGRDACVLLALCASRRTHSLYILRLFNDCFAMLLLYASVERFQRQRWFIGCIIFSLAVSIKMNILLFAPGLLALLVARFSWMGCIPYLATCAFTQLVLGAPFLASYPVNYIRKAFEFDRQFFYKWSVNLQFLPESVFLSRRVSVALLLSHIGALLWFAWARWRKQLGSKYSPNTIAITMFESNFVGIVFARTLHYQFYSWYVHTLPLLLLNSPFPIAIHAILLASIEVAFNVYPPRAWASVILCVAHVIILAGTCLGIPKRDKVE